MRITILRWIRILGVTACVAFGSMICAVGSPTEGPALKIGDAAPLLKPMSWIKGTPVARYEPGRVYVVEFWATWCVPCNVAMPHLSALQKEHANQLTIVGVNVDALRGGEVEVDAVKAFVKKKGEKMAYTVAMDDPMTKTVYSSLITASGSFGLPIACIIDQQGRLAWVGLQVVAQSYPFEQALADTLAGRADLAQARTLQIRANEVAAASMKRRELLKPVREARGQHDYKAALAHTDRIIALHPEYAAQVFPEKLGVMLHVDEKSALAFAEDASHNVELRKQLKASDDTQFWGLVGSSIAQEKGLSQGVYETAVAYLQEATVAKPEVVESWVSLAGLWNDLGNVDQAIAAQERAVAAAAKKKDTPPLYINTLKKTLADYKGLGASTE